MFKRSRPSELNGIAELIRSAEDSKAQRLLTTRRLLTEIEDQRRRQKEAELLQYVTRGQRNGAM